jgi:hypothetical protein
MALLAYNKTVAPLTLAAGTPSAPTLKASTVVGQRGPAENVTSYLVPNLTVDPAHGKSGGLTAANFTALNAQRLAGNVDFEWTSDVEYLTGALIVDGPEPGLHGATHGVGGTDPIPGGAASVPAPSGAGKMLYDTGAAYAELAAGTVNQVVHGGATPSFGAVAAADMAAGAASTNIGTLTGDLAGSTLPATTIAAAAVTSAKMAAGAASSNIGTLTGDLNGSTLPATTIAAGAVSATKMAAGAAATNVGTLGGDLNGSTLPNPAISAGAVSSAKLAAGAASANIGTLTGDLNGSTLPATTIAAGAVTAAKLAASAAATNVGTLGGALSGTLPNPGVSGVVGDIAPVGTAAAAGASGHAVDAAHVHAISPTVQGVTRTISQPADGTSFSVTIPTAMLNTSYKVTHGQADGASIVGIQTPIVGRTTTTFPVKTTGALNNGDTIDFILLAQ